TEILELDLHRNGPRARVDQRFHRGHERIGLDQHFVARAHAGRSQPETERVGSRGDTGRVRRAEERGHLGLERAHLLAAEQLHAVEHALARRQELAADCMVLPAEVDQPYPRRRRSPRRHPNHPMHRESRDPANSNRRHREAQDRALTFPGRSPKARLVLERGQAGPRAAARWGPALLVALLFGVLVSVRLGRPGFFDNAGRDAQVAREMLLRRDLVTPTLNFSLFLNKPPLLYWLAAGAFELGAADEWVRIVGVLASVLSVLITCRLGARLFSEGAGLLAACFLATTLGFVLEARTLRPDSILMATVAGGLAAWCAAEDAPERRRSWWLAAGYVTLAIGVLAKGLVPIALVGIPVFVCTLRDHGWRGLWRLRPLLGVAILLLVAGPWHVAVALRHPGFAWDYIVNQHLLFFLDRKLPRDSEGHPLTTFWAMFLGRSLP